MSGVIVLDTETTSKDDDREVIEAAWLRLQGMSDLLGSPDTIPPRLEVEKQSLQRFKPSKPLTTGSMAVHHILPQELEHCPPSASFQLPMHVQYIVGHAIDFDWHAIGRPAVKRIDTHAMAQWVWPDAGGYSLVALIYMLFGATIQTRDMVRGAHSALTDTHLCKALLEAILERTPAVKTWEQLWAYSEECRIPRTCPMKKYEGVLLEDLDEGFAYWVLRQEWADPYFKEGLRRVFAKREMPPNEW